MPGSTTSRPLFEGVVYYFHPSLDHEQTSHLSSILKPNGARETTTLAFVDAPGGNGLAMTHVISNHVDFKEYQECLRRGVNVVTDKWVTRSWHIGILQQPKFFSPDPALIFSGVVVCTSGLPVTDSEAICAGVASLGGAWREFLTKEVTHLICLNGSSTKYKTALMNPSAGIKIVLPHWFDDCFKLQRLVPEDPYMFPNPPLLSREKWGSDVLCDPAPPSRLANPTSNSPARKDVAREAYYASVQQANADVARRAYNTSMQQANADTGSSQARIKEKGFNGLTPRSNVLQGKKVLLSSQLGMKGGLLDAYEDRIRAAGGEPKRPGTPIKEVDIVVCKERAGAEYLEAYAEEKVVGTLAWLCTLFATGVFTSSKEKLLHYPIPPTPAEGFEGLVITITNYTGTARAYLKDLISKTGAQFTPTMSHANTHVIAASKSGEKVARAEEWNIIIVNHLWLEQCFIKWVRLSEANPRFTSYPPGINYMQVLGDAHLTDQDLQPWAMPATSGSSLPASPVKDETDAYRFDSNGDARMTDMNGRSSTQMRVLSGTAEQDDTSSYPPKSRTILSNSNARPVSAQADDAVSTTSSGSKDIQGSVASITGTSKSTSRQKRSLTPVTTPRASNLERDTDASNVLPAMSRRRAAQAAEDKLHNEIMPDAIRWESEKRRKSPRSPMERTPKKRGRREHPSEAHGDGGTTPPTKKGRATAYLKRQKRKSSSPNSTEVESDDEGEAVDEARRTKSGRSRPSQNNTVRDTQAKTAATTKGVRYCTTGVKVSDANQKALARLGAKQVSNVTECTHLVCMGISRTEKFLCAVSLAPFIVTEKWLLDSIKNKTLLDEADYLLQDPTNEAKHGVILADSLTRAKKGKLFAGHTFYVTPKVEPKYETLRKIVETAGGEISKQRVTTRLADRRDHHVISCSADRQIWEPLREGRISIYTSEIILVSVLKQKAEWGKHRLEECE